jgi:ubiquinone/menaquinone biosynthesis C-methylase UbiE
MKAKDRSRTSFDGDAAAYDKSALYASNRARYKYVIDEALQRPFHNVLDIGCGTGALLSLISQKRESAMLFGVDLSEQMVRLAQAKLFGKANLFVRDSEHLPFNDNQFELITCTFSFHHYPQPIAALSEMTRVLTVSGRLILADIWAADPLRKIANLFLPLANKGDVRIYSRRELCDHATSADLTVVKWSRLGWHGCLMVCEKRPPTRVSVADNAMTQPISTTRNPQPNSDK